MFLNVAGVLGPKITDQFWQEKQKSKKVTKAGGKKKAKKPKGKKNKKGKNQKTSKKKTAGKDGNQGKEHKEETESQKKKRMEKEAKEKAKQEENEKKKAFRDRINKGKKAGNILVSIDSSDVTYNAKLKIIILAVHFFDQSKTPTMPQTYTKMLLLKGHQRLEPQDPGRLEQGVFSCRHASTLAGLSEPMSCEGLFSGLLNFM